MKHLLKNREQYYYSSIIIISPGDVLFKMFHLSYLFFKEIIICIS